MKGAATEKTIKCMQNEKLFRDHGIEKNTKRSKKQGDNGRPFKQDVCRGGNRGGLGRGQNRSQGQSKDKKKG